MPTDDKKGVYAFNEQHAVALLLLIHSEGEVLGFELRTISGNYPKLKLIADDLQKLGLIDIQIQQKPRLTHKYMLTEKGKKVAELLLKIDDTMKTDD